MWRFFSSQTSSPEIFCINDTFINRVGISWTQNSNVENYELQINDTVISLENRFSYLFK